MRNKIKKIIGYVLVLVFVWGISGKISYADTTLLASEVQAIVQILKVFKVSDSDILLITDILNNKDNTPVNNKKVVVDPIKTNGCENNVRYNIKNGNLCHGKKPLNGAVVMDMRYVTPKPSIMTATP